MKIFMKSRLFSRVSVIISCRRNLWRVLFFGNDNYSTASLQHLYNLLKKRRLIERLDVVTVSNSNPVERFTYDNKLTTFSWPLNLKSMDQNYDFGVVVSFGHLIPKKVINIFPMGIINVHASLLPRWRGASPIIHSIMNGDDKTGISIMRIEPHHFDTGEIILQKSCTIGPDELLPSLTSRLSNLGASCLVETIENLPQCLEKSVPQSNDSVSYAPRVSADVANVAWDEKSSVQLYNLYRSLFGLYSLSTSWNGHHVKLKAISLGPDEQSSKRAGGIRWSRSTKKLKVQCLTGTIFIDTLTIGGKSHRAIDFYNGYLSKVHFDKWYFQ